MRKALWSLLIVSASLTLQYPSLAETKMSAPKHKAVIVVTSHEALGKTGEKTGYYLPEVTHPYFEMVGKGLDVIIASPQGGKAPLDQKSRKLDDEDNRRFVETPKTWNLLEHTVALKELDPKKVDAVLFAGGHGTMWDFPDDKTVKAFAEEVYAHGGVVAAVCHGPAALVNLKSPDGKYLVAGKKVATFTNEEEKEMKLDKVVPFLLESKLKERGATVEKAANWQPKVVVTERLVTGQNPASAKGVGVEVAKLVNSHSNK